MLRRIFLNPEMMKKGTGAAECFTAPNPDDSRRVQRSIGSTLLLLTTTAALVAADGLNYLQSFGAELSVGAPTIPAALAFMGVVILLFACWQKIRSCLFELGKFVHFRRSYQALERHQLPKLRNLDRFTPCAFATFISRDGALVGITAGFNDQGPLLVRASVLVGGRKVTGSFTVIEDANSVSRILDAAFAEHSGQVRAAMCLKTSLSARPPMTLTA